MIALYYKIILKGFRNESRRGESTFCPKKAIKLSKLKTFYCTRLLCRPLEQAGFPSGYSTIDHIHSVKQLIERCREYDRPLCLGFRRLWKDFRQCRALGHASFSSSLWHWQAIREYPTGAHDYANAQVWILRPESIKRGMWQGDTMSLKHFTSVLGDIMRTLLISMAAACRICVSHTTWFFWLRTPLISWLCCKVCAKLHYLVTLYNAQLRFLTTR